MTLSTDRIYNVSEINFMEDEVIVYNLDWNTSVRRSENELWKIFKVSDLIMFDTLAERDLEAYCQWLHKKDEVICFEYMGEVYLVVSANPLVNLREKIFG